jgi:hypothetical protein
MHKASEETKPIILNPYSIFLGNTRMNLLIEEIAGVKPNFPKRSL